MKLLHKKKLHYILYAQEVRKMSFGQRLKSARKNKGMTLRELGEAIDRSESVVQRYESGVIANLDNEIIAKLANALNVNRILYSLYTCQFSLGMINLIMPVFLQLCKY